MEPVAGGQEQESPWRQRQGDSCTALGVSPGLDEGYQAKAAVECGIVLSRRDSGQVVARMVELEGRVEFYGLPWPSP